jgi:16S rRNA processing protein RimM
METLIFGQITNAVGLKGELRVYPYTDYKEKFEEIDYVLLEDKKYPIQGVRYMKDMVVLKLVGIDDRTAAEKCKGIDLYIFKKDAPSLDEDAYYIKDLIGLRVIDESGIELGKLKDIIQNRAQDLYEVERVKGGNSFLVPAVEEFILEINLKEGFIRMHLIEGLATV